MCSLKLGVSCCCSEVSCLVCSSVALSVWSLLCRLALLLIGDTCWWCCCCCCCCWSWARFFTPEEVAEETPDDESMPSDMMKSTEKIFFVAAALALLVWLAAGLTVWLDTFEAGADSCCCCCCDWCCWSPLLCCCCWWRWWRWMCCDAGCGGAGQLIIFWLANKHTGYSSWLGELMLLLLLFTTKDDFVSLRFLKRTVKWKWLKRKEGENVLSKLNHLKIEISWYVLVMKLYYYHYLFYIVIVVLLHS